MRYKVTIHDHVIYDLHVDAESEDEAKEIAEDSIAEDDKSRWEIDQMAGWTEVGDIELVEDEDSYA